MTLKSSKKASSSSTACAACGRTPIVGKRCSRCLCVLYCGVECQKVHWPTHKYECKRLQKSGVGGVMSRGGKLTIPSPLEDQSRIEFGFRNVCFMEVEPARIRSCCSFCGIILLKDGEDPSSVAYLEAEPYPTFARMTSEQIKKAIRSPVLPYPAEMLMQINSYDGDVHMHRYEPGQDKNGNPISSRLSTCVNCARILRSDRQQEHLVACMKFCNSGVTPPELTGKELQPNPLEKRLINLVDLYADPDFSKGQASIAGRTKSKKKEKLPFNFQGLEKMAFPFFFLAGGNGAESSGWDPESTFTAFHYACSRLYSVVPKWREDPDYVMFLLHRSIAYASSDNARELAKQMLAGLPSPSPLSNGMEMPEQFFIALPQFVSKQSEFQSPNPPVPSS